MSFCITGLLTDLVGVPALAPAPTLIRMKSVHADDDGPFAGFGKDGKICHLARNQVQTRIISLLGMKTLYAILLLNTYR